MNSISSCCSNPPEQLREVQGDWAYQSKQIAATAITGGQSTDIEIQTADGDKVTLSSEIKFDSAAVAYQALGRTSSSYSNAKGQMFSAHASAKLELTVEGTLDQQEKKDIKAVLARLYNMVKDFITGKPATDEKVSFANLTSIKAVKAEVDINASITVAAQTSAHYATPTPIQAKPAIQPANPSQSPAISERVDKLTDRMIRFVKDSGVEPSKILDRVNRKLSRLSYKLINAGPAFRHRMRLRRAILENFAEKLQKLTDNNGAGTNIKEQVDTEKTPPPDHPAIAETTATISESILNAARQDFHFELDYSVADDR